MTVSTINNPTAELRRTQDNLNKQAAKPLPYQPSGATLPEDVLAASATALARPDQATAIALTEQQNRAAAASTLSEADLDQLEADRPVATEEVARDPQASIAAQTTKLPVKILDLLAE